MEPAAGPSPRVRIVMGSLFALAAKAVAFAMVAPLLARAVSAFAAGHIHFGFPFFVELVARWLPVGHACFIEEFISTGGHGQPAAVQISRHRVVSLPGEGLLRMA